MARLLLVEDHVLVRQSIRAFLQDANYVIGEAGTGAEALRLIPDLKPDLVLLDIHLPEMNGIAVARQIRQQWPNIRIVVLTAYNEKAYQAALAEVGVHDFILKTVELSELLLRINQVLDTPIEWQIASTLSGVGGDVDYWLTEREVEVLQGAARGWTNKQIGVQLDISARTVQVHLYTIYQKLNVSNRTEAVLRALALNLIANTDGVSE